MAGKPKSTPESSKAEAQTAPASDRLPAHKILALDTFADVSASTIELQKLNQIGSLLWFHEGTSPEEKHAAIVRAVDLFESIAPAEGIEAMLATQMVGTHHAALECLRRAMIPSQSFEAREASLSQAQKLMNLYTQQMAALNKHRGKGQQKITVERVQVAPGGQAVLGDVHTSAQSAAASSPALEAPREDTVPLPPMPAKTKARR